MSVLDRKGQVTIWNGALERMLGCSREQAVGRTLDAAAPAIARTELPKAIKDALKDAKSRTLGDIRIGTGAATRTLQVKVLPVAGGVTLLWQDVTERTQADDEIKRHGERLALAAEGANDGLWQWNLRSQEFYVSGRWRAMIGLSSNATMGRPEDWLERVHADDIAALRKR